MILRTAIYCLLIASLFYPNHPYAASICEEWLEPLTPPIPIDKELLKKPIDNLIEAKNMDSILLEIATRRFGERSTNRLEVNFKTKENSDPGANGKVRKILLDSFGRWNLPHSYLTREAEEKKFIGTLCLGRKVV